MSGRPTFDPGFSTPEMSAVFSAESTVEAMLEFESALAMALADAGVAPANEARQVESACRQGVPEPDRILGSTWQLGTPLIALIDAVKVSMGNEQAVRWIHHGATSQDAIDTGRMIQARAALDILDLRLTAIAVRVRELIVTHRDQPQMGRTFLQDARPTTFGFRLSTWLEPILGHVEDLRYQQSRLAIQLGGAVGTRGIFGDAAADVASALAGRLDLRLPTISWHTDRSGILALAQSLERTARTMAKIGSDVALLASSAIREVSVRTGGSSSMSGKRNPIDSVRAIAAASACSGALSMLTSAPAHELDRATGSWHVEWVALPLAFQTADAAIAAIEDCLASLDVDSERMSSQVGEDGLDGLTDAAGHQIDGVLANFDSVIRP